MNKRVRFMILVALSLVAILSHTGGIASAQAKKKLTTSTAPGDPHSLDPQLASDQRDASLGNVLFPGLTTLDPKSGQVVPGLTTGWDVSADGLVYTFHLLKDVPWVHYNATTGAVEKVLDEKGNPRYVTAQDVVYGWIRALDPATGAGGGYMLAPVVTGGEKFNGGKGGTAGDLRIRAVDNFTFEVTAPEKVSYALGLYGIITARPVPQWAIKDGGRSWTDPANINTYGPFALKEWVHDDHLTYIKNPFWPGSKGVSQAKLDELVVRFLDSTVQLQEYEAGNLDVVLVVPGDHFDRIKSDPVLSKELKIIPGMCTTAWNFNTQKAPFTNVHMRRAFSYAVDRQSLAANVFKGGRIAARWYAPPSVAFAPTLEANPKLGIAFDAEKARAELQLGLKDLGIASVEKLPAIIAEFGNTSTNNAVGQALQVMWKNTLGIAVTLNPMDTTTYWTLMGQDSGQIHAGGWCPDYNDANNYTRDVLYSTSANNFGHYNNPKFDALIDEARVSNDDNKRRQLYAQAEQLEIVDDAATMPLVWESLPSLTKPYVTREYVSTGVETYWTWDVNR